MSDPTSSSGPEGGDSSKVDRSLFRGSRAAEMGRRVGVAPPDAETPNKERPQAPARAFDVIKGELQGQLLDQLSDRDLLGASDERIAEFVEGFAQEALARGDLPLNERERQDLARDLLQETMGLGPLAPLMLDPAVSDILVNGPGQVFVERFGRMETTEVRFRDSDHLLRVIERITTQVGRRIDQSSPMVDFRLADGSRVNATIPPVSLDYPTLSIRRFGQRRLRGSDLLRLGSMSSVMLDFLGAAVRGRVNMVISGGTGAGKSTLLGSLAEAIPHDERIITIEDTAELRLDQPHVVRLESRPQNTEGAGQVSIRQLVVNSLRMRPDRIVVGECRSSEALDMLQAMNTGHDGSLTTVHANSPRDALSRLETMVLMAGTELPSRAIREQIASAVQVLVHVNRDEDGVRRVMSISEIVGLEGETPLLQELFAWRRTGRNERRIEGKFFATGIAPRLADRMRGRGVDVPVEWFHPDHSEGGGSPFGAPGEELS